MPEYVPGEWYGVVCDDMAVLLHPRTPTSVVREVFAILRSGAGLSRPLAALLVDGISDLRPFAAVQIVADGLHTALRGDVSIVTTRSGDERRRTATQVVLWTEEHEDAAERVELCAPGAGPDGERLPLAEGVVRASHIVLAGNSRAAAVGTGPATSAESIDTAASGSVAVPQTPTDRTLADVVPVADSTDRMSAEPVAEPLLVAESEPLALPVVEPDLLPTVESHPQPDESEPVAAPMREQDTAPVPEHADESASTTGGTSALSGPSVESVPTAVDAAPAPVLPGPASQEDHDGMTILSGELASIRQNLPSWAVSESGQWSSAATVPLPAVAPMASAGTQGAVAVPPPAPAAEAFPRLVLSTGVVVPVDGVLLVGRAPQADRAPEGVRARLVAVPSPTQDISRTHAEVRVENGRVLVTDLFSTNGITVTSGGLPPRKIAAGEAVAVNSGVVVDLGDGVTFMVEPPV